MKFLALFIITIFSISCNTTTEKTESVLDNSKQLINKEKESSAKEIGSKFNYLISDKNAGIFFVGKEMPLELENFKIEAKTKKIIEEGVEFIENYYQISDDNEDVLTCVLETEIGQEKIIREILISSTKFKTDKGIGINSNVEMFVKAYPDYNIWFTYISRKFVLQSKTMEAVQFFLNADDYIGSNESLDESDMVYLKIDDFKKNSKITKVRLFNLAD